MKTLVLSNKAGVFYVRRGDQFARKGHDRGDPFFVRDAKGNATGLAERPDNNHLALGKVS